ncbi:MAG: hypothetical protein ACYDDO_06205 [Acidiferrobacterales bacterium]
MVSMYDMKDQSIRRQIALFSMVLGIAASSPVTAETARGSVTSASAAAPAGKVVLTANQWAKPRTGQSVARLAGMNALIGRFKEKSGSRLVIRYAAGDQGTLWAGQLRAWLVALGIPASCITLDSSGKTDGLVTIAIQ